jgi:hypothetical protein
VLRLIWRELLFEEAGRIMAQAEGVGLSKSGLLPRQPLSMELTLASQG